MRGTAKGCGAFEHSGAADAFPGDEPALLQDNRAVLGAMSHMS